jgi:hypothetical protein
MRQHEKDFEMAMIFNSIKGINPYGGCLMKENEKFIDANIEAAYNAFSAGVKMVERQLDRYKPDRFIAECILREAGVTEEQFRNVLKQAGDSPVT